MVNIQPKVKQPWLRGLDQGPVVGVGGGGEPDIGVVGEAAAGRGGGEGVAAHDDELRGAESRMGAGVGDNDLESRETGDRP